jgi:hypothetical protein
MGTTVLFLWILAVAYGLYRAYKKWHLVVVASLTIAAILATMFVAQLLGSA